MLVKIYPRVISTPWFFNKCNIYANGDYFPCRLQLVLHLRRTHLFILAYSHSPYLPFAAWFGNKAAIDVYTQALGMCPDHEDGLVARGAAFTTTGRLRQAVQDLSRALNLNPQNDNASRYLRETRRYVLIQVVGWILWGIAQGSHPHKWKHTSVWRDKRLN